MGEEGIRESRVGMSWNPSRATSGAGMRPGRDAHGDELVIQSLRNQAMLTSARAASTSRADGIGPVAASAARNNARRKRRLTIAV